MYRQIEWDTVGGRRKRTVKGAGDKEKRKL
jgi:hypothetical protein